MGEQFPEFANFLAWNAIEIVKTHVDTLKKFGRYPHRNPALKRPYTSEEEAYMLQRRVSQLENWEKSQLAGQKPGQKVSAKKRMEDNIRRMTEQMGFSLGITGSSLSSTKNLVTGALKGGLKSVAAALPFEVKWKKTS